LLPSVETVQRGNCQEVFLLKFPEFKPILPNIITAFSGKSLREELECIQVILRQSAHREKHSAEMGKPDASLELSCLLTVG
jgi:hypothetical protein